MSNLKEASEIVEEILGATSSSSKHFKFQIEDYLCYVQGLSMTSFSKPEEKIRERLTEISIRIITDSIRVFLDENYGQNIVFTQQGNVFDKNMNKIKEVEKIKNKQEKILAIMVDTAMEEFEKGRGLALEIVQRAKGNGKKNSKSEVPSRNYKNRPAVENLEIEMMNLENKLPNLTPEEGNRLSFIYEIVQNQKELDDEVSDFEGEFGQ